MKTSFPKPAAATWYIVDAADQVLGRLSTKIATVLRGRHRADYVPHWRNPDHVIVVNAARINITGNKLEQKTYKRHTGWFGHLRSTTLKRVMEKDPTKAIEMAVKGMLPKNQTRDHTLKQLHVYAGTVHGYDAQKPIQFPL